MGNSIKKIEMIDRNADTPRLKIFLFGANPGKSIWFNERRDAPAINGMTFKMESFKFGDKLPDIETVIYDTAENIGLVDEHLHHVTNADGIILTYDTQDIETLNHLQYSIDQIMQNIFFSTKHTRCLLLGIKTRSIQNPLHHQAADCTEAANQFATRWNLFHKQIDVTQDIHDKEPYLYLLRRILKQKGTNDSDDEDRDPEDSKDDTKTSDNLNLPPQSYAVDEEDTLNLVNDIMCGLIDSNLSEYTQNKPNESSHSNVEHVDHDAACQKEFKRFLNVSLGKTRCDKYLDRFIATRSNDIRFVDPDIFDQDFLTNDVIAMDVLDKKLFIKEIEKYKSDAMKFEKKLCALNMSDKYHRKFVNGGIATLWSFYHHIHGVNDIDRVIKKKHDSILIWESMSKDQKGKKNRKSAKKMKQNKKMNHLLSLDTRGGHPMGNHPHRVASESDHDVDQVEGDDTSSDEGSVGDSLSEDLFGNYSSKGDGGLNNTTDLKNDINHGIMVTPIGYKGGGGF
eukprot:549303_1